VLPPDLDLEDPPMPPPEYDCDNVDDDDMYSTEYFSQFSFDSPDVTSILRGHHFEGRVCQLLLSKESPRAKISNLDQDGVNLPR